MDETLIEEFRMKHNRYTIRICLNIKYLNRI